MDNIANNMDLTFISQYTPHHGFKVIS